MVGSTRRERRYWRRALTDVSSASEVPTFQRSLLVANQISISSQSPLRMLVLEKTPQTRHGPFWMSAEILS